jgi:hypothetical protein
MFVLRDLDTRGGRRFPLIKLMVFLLLTLVFIDLHLRYVESIAQIPASSVLKAEGSGSISPELQSMELPHHVSEVFLNIGSSLDPILPPVDSGDKGLTIAFEPIVGCKIKPHKYLMVVHAAVAATAGLTSMFLYNTNGESSSLSKPAFSSFWNSDAKRDGHIQIVPVITLRQILHAIPSHIAIPYIKTDMQGHDFVAVAAAQDDLFQRNVDYLYTEVYLDHQSSYQNVTNDFCTDWWPHMRRVGYELVYLEPPFTSYTTASQLQDKQFDIKAATDLCALQQQKRQQEPKPMTLPTSATPMFLSEGNALWKRKGAPDRDFVFQTL